MYVCMCVRVLFITIICPYIYAFSPYIMTITSIMCLFVLRVRCVCVCGVVLDLCKQLLASMTSHLLQE